MRFTRRPGYPWVVVAAAEVEGVVMGSMTKTRKKWWMTRTISKMNEDKKSRACFRHVLSPPSLRT